MQYSSLRVQCGLYYTLLSLRYLFMMALIHQVGQSSNEDTDDKLAIKIPGLVTRLLYYWRCPSFGKSFFFGRDIYISSKRKNVEKRNLFFSFCLSPEVFNETVDQHLHLLWESIHHEPCLSFLNIFH